VSAASPVVMQDVSSRKPGHRVIWQRCAGSFNTHWALEQFYPGELDGQLYHHLYAQDTCRLANHRSVCPNRSSRCIRPGSCSLDIPTSSCARSRSVGRDGCTFVAMRRQSSPWLRWSVVGIDPTFTGLGTQLVHTTPDAAETAWVTRQRNAELDCSVNLIDTKAEGSRGPHSMLSHAIRSDSALTPYIFSHCTASHQ